MRQTISLPLGTTAEQQGAHGSCLTKTDGGDGGLNVLHRVVDGETSRDAATGGVDVEVYGLLRVVGFEEEKLGDDGGRCCLFDFTVEADDALSEETGEDVVWNC